MKSTVINGSPRGAKSNSTRILKTWIFPDSNAGYELIYARDIIKNKKKLLDNPADCYLIIFPLYVDSIPAIVKNMFEIMEINKDKFKGRRAWFVIHSGFPEAIHTRLAEKYVKYLSSSIGMRHMGTAIMGGSEALQAAPDSFFGRRVELFGRLGRNIQNGLPFENKTVAQIAGREKLSLINKIIMKMINPSNFYWNWQLKKNRVFDRRFERPYE